MPLIPTQRLDRRIKIMTYEKVKNENFEWVQIWTEKFEIWASVKQQYFKDYQESFGTRLEGTTNFIIRYEQPYQITNAMRVQYNGVNYEIIDVLEGSYIRDFTTLVCKQVK